MANKRTPRGRAQDRAQLAGGHGPLHGEKEASLQAAVKKAVKKLGTSRKRVEPLARPPDVNVRIEHVLVYFRLGMDLGA